MIPAGVLFTNSPTTLEQYNTSISSARALGGIGSSSEDQHDQNGPSHDHIGHDHDHSGHDHSDHDHSAHDHDHSGHVHDHSGHEVKETTTQQSLVETQNDASQDVSTGRELGSDEMSDASMFGK